MEKFVQKTCEIMKKKIFTTMISLLCSLQMQFLRNCYIVHVHWMCSNVIFSSFVEQYHEKYSIQFHSSHSSLYQFAVAPPEAETMGKKTRNIHERINHSVTAIMDVVVDILYKKNCFFFHSPLVAIQTITERMCLYVNTISDIHYLNSSIVCING